MQIIHNSAPRRIPHRKDTKTLQYGKELVTKVFMQQLRFAIFGNTYQPKSAEAVSRFLDSVRRRGGEVCIEREFHNYLSRSHDLVIEAAEVFSGTYFDADFIVSMGGDGTLLKAANYVGDRQLPIIGVNTGRLGFLADTKADDIETTIDAIFDGKFSTEEHAVIEVKGDISGSPYALNDIAVLKRDNASMISITAYINGEYLTTYQADGLIVATPTGSTAYSLSNGGPIVAPQSGIICLTPVAPHSLNVRPIVIPDTAEITLSVESRSHNFLVAIDGRSEKCLEGTTLTIRRAAHNIKIMRMLGRNYYSTLREKMMWGRDNRS